MWKVGDASVYVGQIANLTYTATLDEKNLVITHKVAAFCFSAKSGNCSAMSFLAHRPDVLTGVTLFLDVERIGNPLYAKHQICWSIVTAQACHAERSVPFDTLRAGPSTRSGQAARSEAFQPSCGRFFAAGSMP